MGAQPPSEQPAPESNVKDLGQYIPTVPEIIRRQLALLPQQKESVTYERKGVVIRGVRKDRKIWGRLYLQEAVLVGQFYDFAPLDGCKMVTQKGIYQGRIEAFKPIGPGTFIFLNGPVTYSQTWDNSVPEGFTTEIWPNGDRFIGSFVNGEKHGPGKYLSKKKAFIGTFDQGRVVKGSLMDGEATFFGIFDDGAIKEGVMSYRDGGQYVGSFEKGRKQGCGKFIDCNHRMVEGQWMNGQFVD